jgi:hypothetical protein
MGGAAENCSFAIAHENKVGGIDGQSRLGQKGMAGIDAQRIALLLGALDGFFLVPRAETSRRNSTILVFDRVVLGKFMVDRNCTKAG